MDKILLILHETFFMLKVRSYWFLRFVLPAIHADISLEDLVDFIPLSL